MIRRLVLRLASAVLTCTTLTAVTQGAAYAAEAPVVGTPTMTATSAASLAVSVSVDSLGSATTVLVEYVTAGAYRAKVPSAATTVAIGTAPASDAGPVQVDGHVTGLEPGSTYRMRVKTQNDVGETVSTDVIVSTPRAPKISFKAKVGADTTNLTRLTISGLVGLGTESATVRCKTLEKGCPFTAEIASGLGAGTVRLTALLKGEPLEPGAKVSVQVTTADIRVCTLKLTIRDGQQPKVKRR